MCVNVAGDKCVCVWVGGGGRGGRGHKLFCHLSRGGGEYLVRLGVVKILVTQMKIHPTATPSDNK